MKIGVIAQGRNCADVLDDVLAPWIEAMKKHDIHICLVTATFREMERLGEPPHNTDATWEKFEEYSIKYSKNISSIKFNQYASEAQSRERGRQVLMAKDVSADLIWLLDLSDEYYTAQQIDKIIDFVKSEPFSTWFRLSFKNYVFDKKTYLTAPFTPPRIWRTNIGGYKLSECVYDNDFVYVNAGGAQISDKSLSNYIIPKSVAWIKHYSWLSDERGKKKCAYQAHHFIFGSGCSYRWNEKDNELEWNPAYFKKVGEVIPNTAKDLD